MGFLSNLFGNKNGVLKTKFFPMCCSGGMPYIKVIPKKRTIFCSETITSNKVLPIDKITDIKAKKKGSGGIIKIMSRNEILFSMNSTDKPSQETLRDCLEYIKKIDLRNNDKP